MLALIVEYEPPSSSEVRLWSKALTFPSCEKQISFAFSAKAEGIKPLNLYHALRFTLYIQISFVSVLLNQISLFALWNAMIQVLKKSSPSIAFIGSDIL